MIQAMTQETPGKVMSLLGAALFSMAFLVSVAYTNASFTQTEIAMPSPFDPGSVVSGIDQIASSYSNFLYANVIDSVSQDFALAGDSTITSVLDTISPQYKLKKIINHLS